MIRNGKVACKNQMGWVASSIYILHTIISVKNSESGNIPEKKVILIAMKRRCKHKAGDIDLYIV